MSESVMPAPPERWLPVVGFEGFYDVSDLGRVYSHHGRGRILKPGRDGYGHLMVFLSGRGLPSARKVHRLVLEAFVGPRPEGQEGCHGPGGKTDNRLMNLYWGSHHVNMGADRVRDGTSNQGEQHGMAKLTTADVVEIRRRVEAGETQTAVARDFGVASSRISTIVNRKAWRHC